MNRKQIAKKNMYNKLLVFFDTFGTVWDTNFTRLKDGVTSFVTKTGELEAKEQQQAKNRSGVTLSSNTKVVAMINISVKYARKARVWAQDQGNDELQTLWDVRADDFKIADEKAVIKARAIYAALNANATALTAVNISTTNIASVNTAINNADLSLGKSGAVGGDKKAGTEGIVARIKDIDKLIVTIDDLLVNEYQESNPDMVNQWKNNKKIDNLPSMPTALDATVTYEDDNSPAENIIVKITERNRSAITDIEGKASIERFKPGTYHVQIIGRTIVTQTLVVRFKLGERTALEVKVRRA